MLSKKSRMMSSEKFNMMNLKIRVSSGNIQIKNGKRHPNAARAAKDQKLDALQPEQKNFLVFNAKLGEILRNATDLTFERKMNLLSRKKQKIRRRGSRIN
mmetsp:Transcript_17994/g.34217  ORF Transcript_17994/g.34217 Transcript_17994/m.34217 type:complete len:100 (-) Transcript_17994:222-521(-)